MLLMWTDNLGVGVKAFDDDHKRLIRMINELHGVIQDVDKEGKVPVEEIEIALHRLENYFKYHCLEEERLMEQTAFPGIREHRLEHKNFFAKITEMTLRFRGSSDVKDATELMEFIYGWLTNHIFVTDRKYSSHLHGKGIF
ncbi:MAG TPA: bacteriohemerythrin [Terracidiphilus sp.]